MKTKKLIIFFPSIERGGVEKNFFYISNFLTNYFKNINLITASNVNKISKKIKVKKPKIISSNIKNRKFKYFLCLLILLNQIMKNKNIVVFAFQANLYASLLCKIFNIKIIIRSNSSPTGWSKNFIKKKIFKLLFSLPDKIIVNSLEFKKEMKYNFNVNAKCIYNPLDKSKVLKLAKNKFKFRFFDNRSYLRIISIGRLVDQKNHILLLRAFKKIKNLCKCKLLIIGNGIKLKTYRNYINDNNLDKIVKIIPFQKNPIKFLKKSDLFILSSKYEGLPNVLLESVALKIPIISSNCKSGPTEILSKNKGGLLFKNNNEKDLVKKIKYFIKNKKIMSKKANYAFKNLDRFDKKKNLEEYLKIILQYI